MNESIFIRAILEQILNAESCRVRYHLIDILIADIILPAYILGIFVKCQITEEVRIEVLPAFAQECAELSAVALASW